MQVYKNYGKNNITLNSKKNLSDLYAKSHYESEKLLIENLSIAKICL